MQPISFAMEGPRRVVFGSGGLAKLGEEVKRLGGRKVLLVVDAVVAGLPFLGRAKASLAAAGVEAEIFTEFQPEPAPEQADAGAALARQKGVDLVVGLGGGSAMDVAKAISVLAVNDQPAEKYVGVELVPKPGLPKIMIPTTAGTGSECTWTAVFTMRRDKRKGGINSPYLYPDTALLDPELTYDLPPLVTGYTGMDALAHAVEAFTSKRANPLGDMYALQAIELIGRYLERAALGGAKDKEAREGMMLASFLAGRALAGAGVTACHALAYPLGAFYGINHGTANAMMLPHVIGFNTTALAEKFAAVRARLGLDAEGLLAMAARMGVPVRLSALGVPEAALPEMAEAAMKVKLCVDNNPRPICAADALAMYRAAY